MPYKEPEIKKVCRECKRDFIAWTDRIIFCCDECETANKLAEINSLNFMWHKAIKKRLTIPSPNHTRLNYSTKAQNAINRLFKRVGSKQRARLTRPGPPVMLSPEVIEKIVWELYVEHASLRKTLAAMPAQYRDLLDLKRVHTIVKKYKWLIRRQIEKDL